MPKVAPAVAPLVSCVLSQSFLTQTFFLEAPRNTTDGNVISNTLGLRPDSESHKREQVIHGQQKENIDQRFSRKLGGRTHSL